jgi:hypothetical protein
MEKINYKDQSGFVALLSVIIITVVLVVISVSVSTTSFFSRFNVADAEYKRLSSSLAEACADQALLKLAQDPSYAPAPGGDTISVGSSSCKIFSVTSSPTQFTIQTKAVFQKAVTNIQIIVDNSSYSVISRQELPTL